MQRGLELVGNIRGELLTDLRAFFQLILILADLCLLDTDCNWTVDPDKFVTMGRATPFAGWQVQGKNRLTVWRGEVVYEALR